MTGQQEAGVKLGPVHHLGIVVKDVDEAAKYYASVFGLGPFRTEVYEMDERTGFTYRGRPSRARVKAAFARSGSVSTELVQVLEGETPHTEFLRKKGEGIQHIAFRVDDLDKTLRELAKASIEPILRYHLVTEQATAQRSGKAGSARPVLEVKEVYLNSDKVGGAVIQLIEIKESSAL